MQVSIKIEFEDRVFFQDDDLKCAVLSDGKCVSGQPGGECRPGGNILSVARKINLDCNKLVGHQ